jgi:DNA-directed RNA polymerase subunit RPC12/RpoP
MNINKINDFFSYETRCKEFFKLFRDKQGVVCKRCGCNNHYWKKDKEQYECKECGFRTTLRSGTIMEKSRLPYRYWFISLFILIEAKEKLSILEIQKSLGHKFYKPIWQMINKLRNVFNNGESLQQLLTFIDKEKNAIELITSDFKIRFKVKDLYLKSKEKNQRVKRNGVLKVRTTS